MHLYSKFFNILQRYCYDKVSLNAARCQTAYSTLYIRISKEPELKGLKITSIYPSTKNAQEEHNKQKLGKINFCAIFVNSLYIITT